MNWEVLRRKFRSTLKGLQNTLILLVIFSLVFPFPLLTYAQETTTSEPAPEASTPEGMEEVPVGEEPEPQALMSSGGESTNSSVDTINPNFYSEQDPLTGSFIYNYPLTIPPGRNGVQPQLGLRYVSQQGEDANTLGYGWSIDIPYIERVNKSGTEKLPYQFYFYSSMDGEIARTGSGDVYGAKIENGSFSRYQFVSGTNWVMTDKNGTQYTFGTSTTGRIDNPSNSSQVFRWVLEEIRDTNGNYVNYQYTKDKGQIYPSKITYTNHVSAPSKFEIEFITENRSDIATSSTPGFVITSTKRISEIRIKVDGSWVRKYTLGYGTGDNAARSLLTSITELGKDTDTATTTLPATTFKYRTVNKGWTNSGITSPITFDENTVVVDVNGDNLIDIMTAYKDGGGEDKVTYINSGSGWTASSTWASPVWFYDGLADDEAFDNEQGVRFGDVNGDGLTDIIQSHGYVASTTKTYLNNGAGWTATSTWAPPVAFNTATTVADTGVRLFDANGDGLTDILKAVNSSRESYINTGTGWVASTTWDLPTNFVEFNSVRNIRIEDVTGDGLVDMIESQNGGTFGVQYHTYINTGGGWTTDEQLYSPVDFVDTNGFDQGVRLGDANGDGLTDILQSYSGVNNAVYLNDGYGWNASTTWSVPIDFYSGGLDKKVRLLDANGDGLIDLVQGDTGSNAVYLNNSERVDLLAEITTPEGGVTTLAYKTPTEYKDGSTYLNPQLPFPINALASTSVSDGLGNIASTSYQYFGAKYYSATTTDRRFAGYQKTLKIDTDGNKTYSYFHQGDTSNTSLGEYQDDFSKIGKMYRTEAYDDSNNLFSKSIQKWDKVSTSTNRNYVKLAQKVDYTYDGDADHKDLAESYTYNDGNGTLIQKIFWGEVTGSDDGTFGDTGSDLASTTYSYAASSSVVALPASELTHNQSATKMREARFYYDGQSLGSLTKGLLTKVENWIATSTYASTTKTYDGTYGLVTEERDPVSNLTTYTYDSTNLYPATTTNALSQATGFVYDYSSGKPKQTYDPNGHLHIKTYDGLDRELVIKEPDPTTGTLATTTEFAYTDSNTPGSTKTEQTNHLSSATSSVSHTYFDGLKRKIQTRTETEGSNTYVIKDWIYNDLGLLERESLPYFASSTSRSNPTSEANLLITYAYDPLQRITTVANTVGTTTNAYDQWQTTTTDMNGEVKDYTKDAYGNLITVIEYLSTTTPTTSYTYDVSNNLTGITDALGNIRAFTYDGMNRRPTAQDLHDSADGTFGTWTYTYNNAGNLITKLDPKSQTINYTYDALNRALTEDYTGSGGTEVSYAYDACTNGVGRLCTATSTDAVISLAYNPIGLVASEIKTIDSLDYTTSYSYDRLGNLTNLVYPDNSEVRYNYNAAGLLETIDQKESGSSYVAVVTNLDYAPTGKVSYKEFGSGTKSTYIFDADELYRLKRILTVASSTDIGGLLGFSGGEESFSSTFARAMSPLAPDLQMQILGEITAPEEDVLVELPQEVAGTSTATAEPVTESAATSSEDIVEDGEIPLEMLEKSIATSTATSTEETVAGDMATTSATTTTTESIPATTEAVKTIEEKEPERWFKTSPLTPQNETIVWDYGVPDGTSYTLEAGDNGALKYSDPNGYISFIPASLSWDGEEKKPAQQSAMHTPSNNTYEYKNVLGSGVSVNVMAKEHRVQKDVQIDSLQSLGPIPEGAEYLEVAFRVDTDFEVPLGKQTGKYKLGEYSVILTPETWDSSTSKAFSVPLDSDEVTKKNQTDIQWEFRKGEEGYTFIKYVPVAWLKTAQYPVYTDVDISYGSEAEFDTGAVAGVRVLKLDTDKFAVCWSDNGDSSAEGECKAATVSGSTISYGSASTFATDITNSATYWSTCDADTNKIAVVYANDTNSDEGEIRLATVSGTTIGTWGTALDINSTNDAEQIDCTKISTDKVAISFNDETNSDTGTSVVCTASGTTATCGSVDDWAATDYFPFNTKVEQDGTDKFITCAGSSDNGQVICLVSTVSGTTLTHGSVASIDSNTAGYFGIGVPDTDKFVVSWGDGPNTQGEVAAGTISGTTITMGSTVVFDTSEFYDSRIAEHDTSHFLLGWADDPGAVGSPEGKSNYASVDFGTRTITLGSDETFRGESIDANTDNGLDLVRIGTDKFVLCYGDGSDSNDGKCIIGEKSGGGGGNNAPSSPTSLLAEGQTNPIDISDPTPEFSAIYEDTDDGDISTHYRIQVSTTTDFATTTWDSTKTALASSTPEGTRIADISYVGSALASSTTYYWRIKFWDDSDTEGAWSTATSTFTLAASGGGTTTPGFVEIIQDISFEYDAMGNITEVTDDSQTGTGKVVVYGYDDLYRLTSASTTAASSTPYSETYAYSSIGNITNKSDLGGYTYGETGYTNPHAPTSINGTSLTYDNSGNLTAYGSDAFVWDYRNRLATSTGAATTTYAYDHNDQRVKKVSGGVTTLYPNKYFEIEGATTTSYIWAGDDLIETVLKDGVSTTTEYIHEDHLGSTNVTTDDTGGVVQVLDYYPFGSERIDSGTDVSQRQYIGEMFDEETEMSYLNARYYQNDRGQFISQDPTFLAVGGPDLADKMGLPESNDWEKRNRGALIAFLSDPQLANSYSYGRNNPITNKDPNGNCGIPCLVAAVLAGIFLDVDTAHAPTTDQNLSELPASSLATSLSIAGFAAPGGASKAIKAGDVVSGLRVTQHAAQGFVERSVRPDQVGTALKNGVKYLDTRTNNILHVVGEKTKGGYTIVTDKAQKTLVSVENFVRNLTPKSSPDRFKKLDSN